MDTAGNAARERVPYGKGRLAILTAATTVVGRSGLRGLTYRAVGREAGVSHALITHHFASLDALLAEAFVHSIERSLADSGLGGEVPDLESFLSSVARSVDRDPDIQVFQLEVTVASRRQPELRPMVEDLYARYRQSVRQSLASLHIDDETLVTAVLGALDGLTVQQLTVFDAANTDHGIAGIRALLAPYLAQVPTETH